VGHGQNRLQIWQCNGHENQLFFFDSGKWIIQWAGDSSKCIDAGSGMKAGTGLMLWDCNGQSQQIWGYDTEKKTIFLAKSLLGTNLTSASPHVEAPLARYCMDLAGASKSLGNAVQLWNCNNLWEQQFVLSRGITIRTLADVSYCLDLYGGNTQDGNKVQLWKCNGLGNQQWLFDGYSIRPAKDNTKCVDAGSGMKGGTGLMIWTCNGQAQQNFGYDWNMKTIYLARSATELGAEAPMASICLDVAGGKMSSGSTIQSWACTACWNQQWQVIGPSSSMADIAKVNYERPAKTLNSTVATDAFLTQDRKLFLTDSCPPRPGPAPTPAPGPSPSPYVLGHCENANQHNWPMFDDHNSLSQSPWGSYIQKVYGEIPSTGYPICIYNLFLLYKPLLSQAGAPMPQVDKNCPSADGTYFAKMSGFPASDWGWIHNSNLAHPGKFQVPGNKWVEIMHTAFAMDGSATWFYYAPGSGVFMWTGNTKAYNDHADGVKDLLNGAACKDKKQGFGVQECDANFEDMYKAALNRKLDSIQFLQHADMQCSLNNAKKMGNYAIEIVDLKGSGKYSCSQPNSGQTRFRAGWEAKSICNCDNTLTAINCQGFAMRR